MKIKIKIKNNNDFDMFTWMHEYARLHTINIKKELRKKKLKRILK